MPAKNVEILHVWSLGAAQTGLSGTMSSSLIYFADSTTRAAASESVTIAEIGSSGDYAVTFTPLSAGTYVLTMTESVLVAEEVFEDIVSDVASAAVDSDSYCAEADVVAWAQMGDYSGATTPTETQVLGFMQMRAAEIYGWLREVTGTNAPGPSAYATSINTGTDAGLALSRVCKMANAIGAAMDALESAGAGEAPSRSDRVAELGVAYASLKPEVQQLGPLYAGVSGRYATHISTGEITNPSITSREREPLGTTDATEW